MAEFRGGWLSGTELELGISAVTVAFVFDFNPRWCASVHAISFRRRAPVLVSRVEDTRPAMPSFREFLLGPWRAVPVLGVTQILAWGTVFYPPVMTVPLIAAERGFSFTFAMGGFSAGLLAAGFVSPTVGGLIDRYGGHRVMPFGSLAGARGPCRARLCEPPGRLFRRLDAARRRDGGLALRSGLRDARAHLRREGAPADHGADARRRLRLDGELARDLCAAAAARLAGHISGLRGGAGACRCAAACLRAAAHARRRTYRPAEGAAPPPAVRPATRRDLSARRRGVRRLRVRAVRAIGASAGDLPARRASSRTSSS